jgi:hypothetical protein
MDLSFDDIFIITSFIVLVFVLFILFMPGPLSMTFIILAVILISKIYTPLVPAHPEPDTLG